VVFEGVDRLKVAHSLNWRHFTNTVMNFRVTENQRTF